jgi:hypothetical protein
MQAELQLMHQQSALLIAHAQMERIKLGSTGQKRLLKRPASFHGDDLIDKATKPHLNVFLPFKLHGSRIEQQRKSQTATLNEKPTAPMDEDERIEAEFLRFFDYSRCKGIFFLKILIMCLVAPKQNGTTTPTPEREKPRLESVTVFRNGRGTVSPSKLTSKIINSQRITLSEFASPPRTPTLYEWKRISFGCAQRTSNLG